MSSNQVRASHILIKHQGSRRKASWKDPDGRIISNTTRDAAVSQLKSLRDDIVAGKVKFDDVASRFSDCSSAKCGGDLDKSLAKDQLPILLVPPEGKTSGMWGTYSILDNKFFKSMLSLPCYETRFSGSSEGWLVTLNRSFELTLYKPFMVSEENTDAVIHLPPLFPPIESNDAAKKFYDNYLRHYVYKVTTFTPDPIDNPKDLICVVIFQDFCQLAYIRPVKDTVWTRITGMERVLFDDVIYFNDKFYALTYKGKLTSFDATDPLKSEIKLVTDENPSIEEKDLILYKRYLIKSHEGELLQVQRYNNCDRDLNRVTKKFKVFKLTPDESRWVEMKSLGDVAIFLGDNSSTSIMASKFAGCQGNCIYFTHDKDTLPFRTHGPSDMGMYNLESQSFTSFANIDAEIIAKMEGAPIWVVPS